MLSIDQHRKLEVEPVLRALRLPRAVALCWILAVPLGCSLSPALAETLNASLRETVSTVPVRAAGASIVVTSFRPSGNGPFPWIVLSHGSAPTVAANRAMGRYRPLNPVREWVRRGYAVIVPVRRGYGVSGGEHFGDAYGKCSRPDFHRAISTMFKVFPVHASPRQQG